MTEKYFDRWWFSASCGSGTETFHALAMQGDVRAIAQIAWKASRIYLEYPEPHLVILALNALSSHFGKLWFTWKERCISMRFSFHPVDLI